MNSSFLFTLYYVCTEMVIDTRCHNVKNVTQHDMTILFALVGHDQLRPLPYIVLSHCHILRTESALQ